MGAILRLVLFGLVLIATLMLSSASPVKTGLARKALGANDWPFWRGSTTVQPPTETPGNRKWNSGHSNDNYHGSMGYSSRPTTYSPDYVWTAWPPFNTDYSTSRKGPNDWPFWRGPITVQPPTETPGNRYWDSGHSNDNYHGSMGYDSRPTTYSPDYNTDYDTSREGLRASWEEFSACLFRLANQVSEVRDLRDLMERLLKK